MLTPHRLSAGLAYIALAVSLIGLPVAAQALEGVVRDHDGDGIAGIRVIVENGGARYEAETDGGGAFEFEGVQVFNQAFLKLKGGNGVGRVVVPAYKAVEPLELEYPVISEVVLLHDNDQHFDWNFVGAIQSEIHRVRSEHANVFHFNAGDIFVRHPHRWGEPNNHNFGWYAEQALFTIATMNKLGYDAMAAGNHEMDHVEHYTRQALETAEFPVLAANMDIRTERLPHMPPYTVLETKEGYTIAVLGLSTGNFDGVERLDPIETTQKYLHLAEKHDLFIAVTHIGVSNDRELAEAVPELDVIIGGHSHTLLDEAEMVNGVLVAQAGGGGHQFDPEKPAYLGKVTLALENGRPVEKSGFVTEFTAAGVTPLGGALAEAAAN